MDKEEEIKLTGKQSLIKVEMKRLPLKGLKETTGNPQKMDESTYKGLVKSMKTKGWLLDPAVLWLRPDNEYQIISGHHRIKAAIDAGILETDCKVLTGITEEMARKLVVEANHRKGKFNTKELTKFIKDIEIDFDIDIDSIFEDVGFNDSLNEPGKFKKVKQVYTDKDVDDLIKNTELFFYSFSGGRDSCLAFISTIHKLEKLQKKIEILFVDTGAEFPDLIPYIIRFVARYGYKVTILKSKYTFFEAFPRQWPDVIYRNCIDKLLSDVIDRYCVSFQKPYVLIRGGHRNQSKAGGNSGIIQKFKDKKLKTIWNPNFSISDEDKTEALKEVEEWPGYDKGFARTACWCCPFQHEPQWEALKINYPMLWEEMKILAHKMDWIDRAGDNNIKRFYNYWGIEKCLKPNLKKIKS